MPSSLRSSSRTAADPVEAASTPALREPVAGRVLRATLLVLWPSTSLAPLFLPGLLAWSVGLLYVGYDAVLMALTVGFTWPLLRAGAAAVGPHADIGLAVVIAARNEAPVLPDTVTALLDRPDPPDRIVIVDDGSTDDTARVLAERFGLVPHAPGLLGTHHPVVHWLRLDHGGKANALNAALPMLDEEVVLTIDADTVPAPGAIAAVRNAFAADERLVATTGLLTPICADTPVGRVMRAFQTYEYIRTALFSFVAMRWNGLLLISGAIAGFRRAAVIEVGGFRPDWLTEDYELIHRLRRHGARHGRRWTTGILSDVRVRTEAPGTPAAFVRQRRRWFGGFLQTQHRYREMVGNPRYGALGLAMLPIKAVDTVQPLYGLSAILLLGVLGVEGRVEVVTPAVALVGGKIAMDAAFRLWAVLVYRRWTGDRRVGSYGFGVLSAMVEPFCFMPLRHVGEAWGWLLFLSGARSWRGERRRAMLAPVRGADVAAR